MRVRSGTIVFVLGLVLAHPIAARTKQFILRDPVTHQPMPQTQYAVESCCRPKGRCVRDKSVCDITKQGRTDDRGRTEAITLCRGVNYGVSQLVGPLPSKFEGGFRASYEGTEEPVSFVAYEIRIGRKVVDTGCTDACGYTKIIGSERSENINFYLLDDNKCPQPPDKLLPKLCKQCRIDCVESEPS